MDVCSLNDASSLICAAEAGDWGVVHLAYQRLRPLCWGLRPHNRQPAGGPSPAVRPAVPRRDTHGEVPAAAQRPSYYIALPSGRHMQPTSLMPVFLSSIDRGPPCLDSEKGWEEPYGLPACPPAARPACATLRAAQSAYAAPALWHVLHSHMRTVTDCAEAMCRCGERLPSTWGATQSRWRQT